MASDYSLLTDICKEIVARGVKVPPSTERGYYAQGCFTKATLHAGSIRALCRVWTEQNKQTDVGAVCILARCIIETRNAVAYLLEPNISRHEAHLRLHLVGLNHSVDLFRVNKGLNTSKDHFWHERSIAYSRRELESNSVFSALDTELKKKLLRGRSPFQYSRYKGKRPLTLAQESSIYTLLSHSSHSFSLSLSGFAGFGNGSPAGTANSFRIATEVAQIYLADTARTFSKFRRRAVGRLSDTEMRILEEASEPTVLMALLKSIRSGVVE